MGFKLALVAAAPLLACLPGSMAQNSPYENLVLADCGIGYGANGGSTSREMIYFSGDVWTGNGLETYKHSMMVNVPWSGDYPWGQAGGAHATMPNGDRWSVYIDRSVKDPNAAGDAWHSLENHKPLKCYSYHWDKVLQLADGKWCSSAYVCNHRGTPYVKPGSGGGGGGGSPPPSQQGREFRADTNAETVDLYNTNAASVISTVRKRFDGNADGCDHAAISLPSGCSISWNCYGDKKVQLMHKMASAFEALAQTNPFKDSRTETWDYCVRWDARGNCNKYAQQTDYYARIPRSLSMTVYNLPRPGTNDNESIAGKMSYSISCSKSTLSCKLCNGAGILLSVANVAAGGAVLLTCTAGC